MLQTTRKPDVQYHGSPDTTGSCLRSLVRLVEIGHCVESARLLTCVNRHAFLLEIGDPSPICIKSGFTSGYPGEGSAGLALALQLLQRHRLEVEECAVSASLLGRLNESRLTDADLSAIREAKLRRPTRIYDYMRDGMRGRGYWIDALRSYESLVIPWPILDERLFDLALEFEYDPDTTVFRAFRKLEDALKSRCSMPLEAHGARVFKLAFRGSGSLLEWPNMHHTEAEGRAQMFEGAYSAFRNARAHREDDQDQRKAYREFLVVNELFLLEAEAVQRGSHDPLESSRQS